jgi:hypothetical protein
MTQVSIIASKLVMMDANYNQGVGVSGTFYFNTSSGCVPMTFINGVLCSPIISSGSGGYSSGSTPTSGSGPSEFTFLSGPQGWILLGTTSPGTINPGVYGVWTAGGLECMSASGQEGYGSTTVWRYTSPVPVKVSDISSFEYAGVCNFTENAGLTISFQLNYASTVHNFSSISIDNLSGPVTSYSGIMPIDTPGSDHDVPGEMILLFSVTTHNNIGDNAIMSYFKLNGIYLA